MENKICLDTDFLVDFLRNSEHAVEFIRRHELKKDLATTYINLFELYYGAYKSKEKNNNVNAITQLKNRMNILNLSDMSVKLAGEQLAILKKKGKLIDFRDILIGTIAKVNGYSVKTNNKKHFRKIQGLSLSA